MKRVTIEFRAEHWSAVCQSTIPPSWRLFSATETYRDGSYRVLGDFDTLKEAQDFALQEGWKVMSVISEVLS